MILNINQHIFNQTVAESLALSASQYSGADLKSIERQIVRAVLEIEANPFLQFDRETGTLRVISRQTLAAYTAQKGRCFRSDGSLCPAKRLCWHRIARRLLARYYESIRLSAVTVDLSKTHYAMKPKQKKQRADETALVGRKPVVKTEQLPADRLGIKTTIEHFADGSKRKTLKLKGIRL